jgi:GT2 family glycosyltransferase
VSRGSILAFTDDDVRVDASWLEALVRGFCRAARVGCVTGCVLPAELETEAQELFDAKAGWGSRFSPALYDLSSASGDELLPFRAGTVGAGASFAVSRAALERVGGFDEALGAGTPSRGGEDLDYFSRLLLDGFAIAYEPSSVAWHYHRRTEDAIRRQMTAYGSGLAAYATKQLVSPRSRGEAVRRLVPALSRLCEISSGHIGDTRLPARLRIAEARGMVSGSLAYLKSRRHGSNGAA